MQGQADFIITNRMKISTMVIVAEYYQMHVRLVSQTITKISLSVLRMLITITMVNQIIVAKARLLMVRKTRLYFALEQGFRN